MGETEKHNNNYVLVHPKELARGTGLVPFPGLDLRHGDMGVPREAGIKEKRGLAY